MAGTPKRDYLDWEFHERGFHQAIRQGDWKLVRQAPAFKLGLFNLSSDVVESRYVSAKHPEIVARMERPLRSARTENPNFPSDREVQSVAF